MSHSPAARRRSGLGWVLAIAFALTMVMGTGPGVLLVNRPETFLGIPLVYAWGIFWYLVQVAIAVVAYFTVWKEAEVNESTSAGESH